MYRTSPVRLPQGKRNGGRNGDPVLIVFTAGDDDAHHGGGPRYLQRNKRARLAYRPCLDHSHIDSERCLVDAGNERTALQEAEQRRAYRGETAGHQITYRKGHAVADHTTKGADSCGRERRPVSTNTPDDDRR